MNAAIVAANYDSHTCANANVFNYTAVGKMGIIHYICDACHLHRLG
jgi:hypothetical protein